MDRELVEFERWLAHVEDPELLGELRMLQQKAQAGDDQPIREAFYADLQFGTAGLRGVIGAGSNRMNTYTVGRATQGFANYLNAHFENPSVAIGRDSRNKGDEFVRHAASVFAANGVTAYVFESLAPTPAVSFAVRDLGCSGGVCMTASHNPAPYNGYKAYGPDGCQIATEVAAAISEAIAQVDLFADVRTCDFNQALADGSIRWIGEDTFDRFIDAVESDSVASEQDKAVPLRVVFTPLNGAGLECVSRILVRAGIDDVTVVPEQAQPDGDFPTCPYPNPEIREALQKGIELCAQVKPDLLLATDPDADRVGIAVSDGAGDMRLLSGNEVGVLLLDYLANRRQARGEDVSKAVAVTTIVSSVMVDALAQTYGFEVRRVLTGFKYIGNVITELAAAGHPERFLFGFEESYGYLGGTHVRDKDAVDASLLICQMAQYYKRQGMDLGQAMDALYARYGFYLNKTLSFEYPGMAGAERMAQIMAGLRERPLESCGGLSVEACVDYAPGVRGLPAADVVQFDIAGANKVIVRPSGTEPKVKVYLFARGETRADAEELLAAFERDCTELLG